jgi:tetraacyldisaccharide 4'-kinase
MLNNKLINILFIFGRLFSPFYSLAMRLRAKLYSTGIKSSTKLSIPVISVGNLSMGGTGKTPMVMYLSRLMSRHNLHPAIISRGYGGKSKKPVNIVSDGENILMSASQAGDEPVLLAKALKVPVITGPKRVVTGQYVVTKKMADIVIMDDGYQHLALRRDLNIALFSGDELLGNGWVFPGGQLREPPSALKRADCFVITGVTVYNRDKVDIFCQKLRREYPEIPVFRGSYRAAGFINSASTPLSDQAIDQGERFDSAQRPVPALAFCGIAKPQSFFDLLQSQKDFKIKSQHSYADHHPYTENDLLRLSKEAAANGCEAMLTTEKDLVKIQEFHSPLPIWALRVELAMNPEFDDFIITALGE